MEIYLGFFKTVLRLSVTEKIYCASYCLGILAAAGTSYRKNFYHTVTLGTSQTAMLPWTSES